MTSKTVYAALIRDFWARVDVRLSEPERAGRIAVHASAEMPAALRRIAAAHALPMTYELSIEIALDDARGQWAVDLLICDVVATCGATSSESSTVGVRDRPRQATLPRAAATPGAGVW